MIINLLDWNLRERSPCQLYQLKVLESIMVPNSDGLPKSMRHIDEWIKCTCLSQQLYDHLAFDWEANESRPCSRCHCTIQKFLTDGHQWLGKPVHWRYLQIQWRIWRSAYQTNWSAIPSLREGSFMSIDRYSVNSHVDSMDVDMEPVFSHPPTSEITLESVTKRCSRSKPLGTTSKQCPQKL